MLWTEDNQCHHKMTFRTNLFTNSKECLAGLFALYVVGHDIEKKSNKQKAFLGIGRNCDFKYIFTSPDQNFPNPQNMCLI